MSCPPDPVFVLRGATDSVTSITFIKQQNGDTIQHLAAGTQDGHILIWNLKTKFLIKEWTTNSNSSILWLHSESPDELWAHERYEGLKVWDISTTKPIAKIHIPMDGYLGFGSPHNIVLDQMRLLAIPGPGQEGVSVWCVDKNLKICSLVPKDPKKYGSLMQTRWIDLGDEGKVSLAAVYESGHISLWDWSNKIIISECQVTENPICFTYHKGMGIIGTASEKVYILNFEGLSIVKEFTITNQGLSSCIVRPDGKLYVTGGWDSRIRIFSSKKHKPLAVLQYHKKTIECLAYSSEALQHLAQGFLLAAGSADKSISLWDIFNSRLTV